MSTIQSISSQRLYETQPLPKNKKVVALRTPNNALERDKVSFSANKEASNEKVTFGEGIKLVAKGFWNKVKDIAKTVIHHPVKTLGAIALTTAGLAALPLIGISTATGAAVLAIGFAALAVGKTIIHTTQAIKHNNNSEYNKVREDLQKIGGDGLDLALSVPFVPKAINAVKRQIKYTSNGLKPVFNKDLWSDLKITKGLWNKIKEFTKADLRIAYEQHVNEMGLRIFPELKFAGMQGANGGFTPLAGEITINTKSKLFNPFFRNIYDGILKHELKHFKQYKQMARTEGIGIEGIQQTIINKNRPANIQTQIDRVKTAIEDYHNPPPTKSLIKRILRPLLRPLIGKIILKKMQKELEFLENLKIQPAKNINSRFYQGIIDQEGTIAAGTPEAAQAIKYFDASSNYLYMNKHTFVNIKPYRKNLLEQEAKAVEKQFGKGRPGIPTVLVQETSAMS